MNMQIMTKTTKEKLLLELKNRYGKLTELGLKTEAEEVLDAYIGLRDWNNYNYQNYKIVEDTK